MQLTLATILQRVVKDSMTIRRVWQGGRERMAGGNIISTEHDPYRIYDFMVRWVTQAEENAVRAAQVRGQVYTLTDENGDAFFGTVDLGDTEIVRANAPADGDIHRRCKVHIEEVIAV